MKWEKQEHGDTWSIHCIRDSGIPACDAADFECIFKEILTEVGTTPPKNIIINMKSVDFLRSSGLGSILKFSEALKEKNITVAVASPPLFPKNIFEIAGLGDIIRVFPDEDTAIRELHQHNE